MKRNPLFVLLLVLLGASLLLSACGGAVPAAPEEPTVSESEGVEAEETEVEVTEEVVAEPADPKIITISFLREWDSLNPLYSANYYSRVTQQIWNCDPWVFDENDQPLPVLLTEMPSLDNGGVSQDGKTITLHLRDDITWSDGEPITADDFVFTWEMANEPANAATKFPYDLIETMEAADATTVILTFTVPYVPWRATTLREIIPEHVLNWTLSV